VDGVSALLTCCDGSFQLKFPQTTFPAKQNSYLILPYANKPQDFKSGLGAGVVHEKSV